MADVHWLVHSDWTWYGLSLDKIFMHKKSLLTLI